MASGSVRIREAEPADWSAIWPFFREIVRAGETYAYDRDMGEEEGRRLWMLDPPARTVVALTEDGAVAGTANMYANRPGGGSHVASASFGQARSARFRMARSHARLISALPGITIRQYRRNLRRAASSVPLIRVSVVSTLPPATSRT